MLRLYSPLEDASLALPWEQREVAGILVGVKQDVRLESISNWKLRIQLQLNTALLSTVRPSVCVSQA